MATVYGYDVKGNLYPFFFLVILLLIFIPTTTAFVRHHLRNLTNSVGTDCTCKPCAEKALRFKRRRREFYLKPRFLIHLVLFCGGWFMILQLSIKIQSSPQIQIWDPFRLLEVSAFSSTPHIKRQYKRKSLKFHPDKRSTDVTKEEAEAIFIDITKAYKALTDPIIREELFSSGNPDGPQESKIGVAFPTKAIKREIWTTIFFGYITIFAIIVPTYVGLRWSQSQKTKEGLYCRTAFKFFSAAAHRKKLEFAEMIKLLSECDEIVEAVQSYRKLEVQKLVALYLTLSMKREIYISSNPSSPEIAEMLLYAHLNRHSVAIPFMEVLQERILIIYPFLANQFLGFLADAKYTNAMISAIHVIQAIKQAVIPNTPIQHQHANPRISIWNNTFRVVGENQVFTDSRVVFWGHAYLHDTNTQFLPFDVQMENSDDEECDVDVLISRKKRKNDGDRQELPAAHTPYYPEYCKPRWYMFFTCQDQVVTWPILITDIPYSDSGLQPRRIRFNFYAPSTSGIFKIKLHVMSDTYIGVDWETEMILNVVARKGRQALKDCTEDESDSVIDRISKAIMNKALLQLPAGASEDEMQSKLEMIVTQFLEEKEKNKSATRKKALPKVQDGSSPKDDKLRDHIKTAVEPSHSEDARSDHKTTNSKDISKMEVVQSQSADIKAEAKRQAHLLWQRVYGRKPILCNDLEKIIPNTLTTSKKWNEMASCDPQKDYVSEWTLRWDSEDDDDENRKDKKEKLKGVTDFQELNPVRSKIGLDLHF